MNKAPLADHPAKWYERPRTQLFVAASLFGGLLLLLTLPGFLSQTTQSTEALYRARVADDLFAGLSRGRQGFVGSLRMAPLPTVAISLVSSIPGIMHGPWAGYLIGLISTLFLCVYADRLWRSVGVSAWIRYPSIASLAFLPPVVMSIEAGRSSMLFVALVVSGWGFLTSWLRQFDLRDLAYSSLLLGLSVLVRYQGLFILALAAAIVLGACLIERRSTTLIEGTGITFLLPGLYCWLLWMGGNWLIMEDPVFFLRSIIRSSMGDWSSIRAALLVNCHWTLLGTVAMIVLSVPVAWLAFDADKTGRWINLAPLPAVGAAAVLMLYTGAASDVQRHDTRINAVVHELEEQHPSGSFIVMGYEGYQFKRAAGHDPDDAWVHLMHVTPDKLENVIADFKGRDLYILVNRERTLERWHQVGLNWQHRSGRIPERFLYRDNLGPWVVFELIKDES